MNQPRYYKINRNVRPYGGRTFPGFRHTYPNGRQVVVVYVATSAAHKNTGLGGDPREYDLDEVTEVPAPQTNL